MLYKLCFMDEYQDIRKALTIAETDQEAIDNVKLYIPEATKIHVIQQGAVLIINN